MRNNPRLAHVVLAAATALLLSGCSQSGPASRPSGSAQPSASPAPGRESPLPSPSPGSSGNTEVVDFTDPEQVAAAYVLAFVKRDYTDPDPRAYLQNVKPYTTAGYYKRLHSSTSDHCDRYCQAGRKNHLRQSADNVGTVIPPEAPRSSKKVWVQVSYEESTVSSHGGGAEPAPKGVVLRMQKSSGKWRVAEKMRGS
ncbi:hypothetical protein [Streptomyces sp. PU-14G]|uniref:hypothetical protein n=1 Tax=Streptomyces sp. PU-14G TaxID=2800808 RepID=UPI0034E032E3